MQALAILALLAARVAAEAAPEASNSSLLSNSTTFDEIVTSSCSEGESLGCLKAAMAGLVPALAVPRRVVVWPGLAVIAGGFSVDPPPEAGSKVDGYLARGFRAFLASLSLQVRVLDSEVGKRLAKFSRMFTDNDSEADTGRKKKVNNALLLGALFSGGTLLALGMAAISAMAGKAMVMSLLSLGMTLMNRNGNGNGNGGGGGSEKTTYEIIHTVPSHHDDYTHRHWADVSHDGYHVVKAH